MGKLSPFKDANTFRRHLEKRFNEVRKEQADHFQKTAETVSISFDGWSARNHKHILGAIAYWIDSDWKRHSMNVEFANLVGKSGEKMAELLYSSFHHTIETETFFEDDKGQVYEHKMTAIGLDIAHKVFAVCGDNATPNDTFCDHFYRLLKVEYDDDPTTGIPHCWFKGRESRIRCLAHIIALIASSVFEHLGGGSTKEAEELISQAFESGGVFPDTCRVLSVYMKIRMIAIWVGSSDERVAAWAVLSTRRIPADVETRWNSLYLMILEARKQKVTIQKYAARFPELAYLVPTNEDWRLCEQVKRTIEPFYNYTLDVSTSAPHLNDYLITIWGLIDTLAGISSGEAPFHDIVPELQTAFKMTEMALNKWVLEINDIDMIFASQALDPRFKFTLIRQQYGDEADAIISRVKNYCRQTWPLDAANSSSSNQASNQPPPPPPPPPPLQSLQSIHTIAALQRAQELNLAQEQAATMDEWDRWFETLCETNFDANILDFHLH